MKKLHCLCRRPFFILSLLPLCLYLGKFRREMNPISQSDPIWPTFLFFALLCWCSTFPSARLFYFVALVNSWLESSLCLWSWCCHSICKEGKCFCSASLQSCFFSSINITYAIWSAKKGFWCCWSSIWKKKSPSHFSQFLSSLPLGFEMSLNRKCDAVSWYTLFCIIYYRTKYLKSIPAFNLILIYLVFLWKSEIFCWLRSTQIDFWPAPDIRILRQFSGLSPRRSFCDWNQNFEHCLEWWHWSNPRHLVINCDHSSAKEKYEIWIPTEWLHTFQL